MNDILIINGTYPNFKKNEWVTSDIYIKDGKIVDVCADRQTIHAEKVIDASGKIVSPGFIDMHMHEEDFLNDGEHFEISELMRKMGVTTAVGGNCGFQAQPMPVFRDIIKKLGGIPINYYMLAGYNTYRNQQGLGQYDSATDAQIEIIAANVKREMEQGAKGVSFGGEYDPGISTQEILKGLEVLDNDAFVSMHYRTDATANLDALHEMIDIAEKSRKRFQISHLSSYSAMGQMQEVLEILNKAIEKNPRLNYDTYPYVAFSTDIGSAVFDEGWVERWNKGYECIMLLYEPYCGVRCDKALFEKVRKENPEMAVAGFVMEEGDIAMAISNQYGTICSDGGSSGWKGHPRSSGTFPRVLGKYVREDKVISLIDALRKMTFDSAQRLGLEDVKGVIAVGADADITVFDPETIEDTSDFLELCKTPKGIEWVIVNGKIAISQGVSTKILSGVIL